MKWLCLILIFLVSATIKAQSCGSVSDGETIRLDTPGKSLANVRIQDQDGLGTCYANVASLILQSVLPGNPEVSYLYAAMANGAQYNLKTERASFAFDANGRLANDGGFPCRTIWALQEVGGGCRRQDVPLEDAIYNGRLANIKENQRLQLHLINLASQFYESINLEFNKEQKFPNYAKQSFDASKKVFASLAKKWTKTFGSKESGQIDDSLSKEEPLSISPDQERKLFFKNALKELFDQKMKEYQLQDCQISNAPMGDLPKAVGPVGSSVPAAGKNKVDKAKKRIKKSWAKKKSSKGASQTHLPLESEQMSSEVPEQALLPKRSSYCVQPTFLYFTNEDGLIRDFAHSPYLKDFSFLGHQIQELAIALNAYKLSDIKPFTDFILNSVDINYLEAMTMLFAPTCDENSRIKIPDHIKCHEKGLAIGELNMMDNNVATQAINKFKKEMRNDITLSIRKDKAVGLAIAAKYMTYPSHFYNQFQSQLEPKHGMTIIGYRCRQGKLDYLVQNSWGDWKDYTSGHEVDSSGKVWFEESSLAKNTASYSVIDESQK